MVAKFSPYKRKQTEPDIRKEMNHFLDGSFPEIAKGQKAVHRKMRRDENNVPIDCPCVDSFTKEADLDTWCPVCMGEFYLWDEEFIEVYKIVVKSDVGNAQREFLLPSTLMNIPIVVFYTRSSVNLHEEDKIVEIERDSEGKPILPFLRRALYSIGSLEDFRSDEGRLEFWKIACYKEKRKFLNGPKD